MYNYNYVVRIHTLLIQRSLIFSNITCTEKRTLRHASHLLTQNLRIRIYTHTLKHTHTCMHTYTHITHMYTRRPYTQTLFVLFINNNVY